MAFIDDLEQKADPIRQAILRHPFVASIGDGSLDVEKFKFYISQDYVYLIDYSRVLALASAKAPDLESMSWFARLLHHTLNTEMELHQSYCAELGISHKELEATEATPTTLAYTNFLLKVAYQDTFAELVAVLLPCQWGYWEIGDYLQRRGEPKHAPLYCQWIGMYASAEFKALACWLRNLANRLGQDATSPQLDAMELAYITSLRYEYLFWDMSYRVEQWSV